VESLLASLGPWTWIIIAAVLMALELAAPGAFMIWLGFAAAATGILAFVTDLTWPIELLIFAILGLVFALIGRRVNARFSARRDDAPFLNRRGDALVGRVFVLDAPIVMGAGRVRIEDSVWRIRGPDAASGTTVKVRAVDGTTLLVDLV
jgi:membrane protein implicated in regulation of membrane protease activity